MVKCKKGYVIKILDCNAGFYIGTWDREEGPNCRLSARYYKTKEEAADLLKNGGWTTRSQSVENLFCNGGDCEFCHFPPS